MEAPRTAGPSRRASRILPPAQGSLVQSNGVNVGHASMHQAARGLPPRHGLTAAQSGWAGAAAQALTEPDNQQQTHGWQLQQRPQQQGSWQSVEGLREQPTLPAAELSGAAMVQQPRVGEWEPAEPAGVVEHGVVSRGPSMENHEEAPAPMRVRHCIEQYLPPQQALRMELAGGAEGTPSRRSFNASPRWVGWKGMHREEAAGPSGGTVVRALMTSSAECPAWSRMRRLRFPCGWFLVCVQCLLA